MMSQDLAYSHSQNIDKEKLKRLLPKGTAHVVADEIIDLINGMENHTGLFQDYMEESFLSHLPVLKEVKVSLREYIDAIKFCNLKKGMTNSEAWAIVFPLKYDKLVQEKRKISSHVSMYNLSTIVTKLDAQMAVNISIQYAPLLHKSLMKQASIMDDPDASLMVQHLASKTLIENLKPLEEQKHQINIGQTDEAKEATTRMTDQMRIVAENQQKLIEAGHSLQEVQRLNLVIEVEGDNDDEEEFIDIGE